MWLALGRLSAALLLVESISPGVIHTNRGFFIVCLCLRLFLQVYHTTTAAALSWTEVTVTSTENGMVTFASRGGGIFVAKESPDVIIIASIAAACAIVLFIVVGTIVYFRRFPEKWSSMKRRFGHNVTYARRSLQSKV